FCGCRLLIMFPNIRPEIIVLSHDALDCDLQTAASVLKSVVEINTVVIDSGSVLAVWGHDYQIMSDGFQPDHVGPPPVHLALNKVVVPETLGLFGSFPSASFFANFLFPLREEPYRMVEKCDMKSSQPLRLRLHTYKDLGNKLSGVKETFLEWFAAASDGGFHGEILSSTLASVQPYSKPAESPLPRQLGWEIVMARCNEVFFPWLELFFVLRRILPKSMRVSLEFSHPS